MGQSTWTCPRCSVKFFDPAAHLILKWDILLAYCSDACDAIDAEQYARNPDNYRTGPDRAETARAFWMNRNTTET